MPAPLFSRHPVRMVAGAALAALAGHLIMKLMPHSLHAFNLTQTSVAILALASLIVLIGVHHNREGQILTQTQEEVVLIGAFGLFWLAFLVAMRAFNAGGSVNQRPYPCSGDDIYCIEEEWSFF
ncbi:hypothetical protein PLICRDRAFT_34032 [Plicaturopsis crispa FD-325 SS-3]|nr:hypothetical protein PLICRDRAFT_34032 [Plicaturopsis crispa FD-325 SS-3]